MARRRVRAEHRAARRPRAQPARAGGRGGAHQDPRRCRRLHRPRRPGPGPDGLDRPRGRGLGRPAALPLRHQGAPLRRGAELLPRGLRRAQPARHGAEPATAPPSGSRPSSTGACPATSSARDEWLLWQELALLCIRDPHLAKVGAELYEDLYATVADIVSEGVDAGVFDTALDPRMVAETAVALTDGLGARVLASDPNLGLDEARATIAATVGILVGHDGPLPPPAPLRRRGRGVTPRPVSARSAPERGFLARRPGPRRVAGAARLRLHPRRRPDRRPLPQVREGRDRRRPRLLQLGRLPRPRGAQGLPGGVRRQGDRVQLRLDGGHVRQARRRQPVRHRLPDRQVGREAAARGQAPRHRPRPA